MKVVFDIEANGLKDPTKIWVIVCKEIGYSDPGKAATDITHIFRRVTDDETEKQRFLDFSRGVELWIGHNVLNYDCPVLASLLNLSIDVDHILDTFVISKLVDYSREGHSIESYGLEFNIPKLEYTDFSKYSEEMETYCVRDVDICCGIYNKYFGKRDGSVWDLSQPSWSRSIDCEQRFQRIVNDLHNNGFSFNRDKAIKLLDKVTNELSLLDTKIMEQFPPKQVIIRHFTPRATKFGTINRTSVPRSLWHEIENYKIGETYPVFVEREFNPASHKQIVDVLNEAGWTPVEKTKTHIDTLRVLSKDSNNEHAIKSLDTLTKYGYKINENNLATLPAKAPAPARTLAQRILYESRRRTLTEWLSLVNNDERIHGKFLAIGAWTHRMAHQEPNTANIPNDTDTQGRVKLLGAEMRSLWCAPPGKLLVGVDAEGIQLRVFAHYINDEEFTDALVNADPHTLNQQILGKVCKSRDAAKRFIYALLLGAGIGKLSEVLGCTRNEATLSLERLLKRYQGFAKLKKTIIPKDAKNGWFRGLDDRRVKIFGDTDSERRHLCMSGYLQNGEAVIMKHATLLWYDRLTSKNIPFKLVNMVHDEWQTECINKIEIAEAIAKEQCKALEDIGKHLKLKCPLAGSYISKKKLKEGHPHPYTIDTNWRLTH
jgi:DNA polymerase I